MVDLPELRDEREALLTLQDRQAVRRFLQIGVTQKKNAD